MRILPCTVFKVGIVVAVTSLLIGLGVATQAAASTQRFSIVTGPVGGAMYAVSGTIAEVLNRTVKGMQFENQAGGGSVYSARVLADRGAEFGMVGNDVAYYSLTGTTVFEGSPIRSFKAVAALYPEFFHMVTRRGSPIRSLKDIIGKRVAVGPSGSGTLIDVGQILQAYGIKFEDFQALRLGWVEAGEYLRDGHADAAMYVTGVPYGLILDITVRQPIDIVGIEPDMVDTVTKRSPFFVPMTIPAGTYPGVNRDVPTVAVKMMLVAREDVPEDVVYEVTRTILDNLDTIKAAHNQLAGMTAQSAVVGVPIPFHPGAERLYRERGILK